MRKITLILLTVVLIATLSVALIACNSPADEQRPEFNRVYGITKYSYKILGNVDRQKPIVSDGGLQRYPIAGQPLTNATLAEKQSIRRENDELLNYDKIDSEGNLFLKGEMLDKKLTKHTVGDKQFFAEVDGTAPAVAKTIYITPNSIGNQLTGLYAPAGELVTVLINDDNASRGMRIDIGFFNSRGGANVIPEDREFSRMPVIHKSLTLDSAVNYVGSPLGGAIYMHNEQDRGANKGEPYEVTIIGAIETPHYYLGVTTDEEAERLVNVPGLVFDMHIEGGIRLTMPATLVRGKSAVELRNVAHYWEKAAALSNEFAEGDWYATHAVTQLYDTYVPAGAAVAIVGASYSVLPTGWGAGALDYESMVTSGNWGNLHEFNHHHQRNNGAMWGSAGGGEVTNNVLNMLTYSLYSNIATNRSESGGLSGWNWCSDAYYSLKDALGRYDNNSVNNELSMYANIAHYFGDETMYNIAKTSRGTEESFFQAVVAATGYDMTYYLSEMCNLTISKQILDDTAAMALPMFVPVANLYQAGYESITSKDRSGEMVTRDIMMGKPYYVSFGDNKSIDIAAYTAIPKDFNYTVVNITKPTYGSLARVDDLNYVYTPDKRTNSPDEIRLTLKLSHKTNSSMRLNDVTLILQFMLDVGGVEGMVWNNPGYSDIDTFIAENYESNTSGSKVSYSTAGVASADINTITVVQGKVILPKAGSYKFYIKGDDKVTLYGGIDRARMTKLAQIDDTLADYSRDVSGASFVISLKANEPLYYKMYVMNKGSIGYGNIGYEDSTQMQGANPDGGGGDTTVPIVNIPIAYLYKSDANEKTHKRNEYGKNDYSNKYFKSKAIEGAILQPTPNAVVSKSPNQYGDSQAINMIDGDITTVMHSATGLSFPQEIIVDLGEVMYINRLIIVGFKSNGSETNGRGRIKDYVLSGAVSIAEGYEEISIGVADNKLYSVIAFAAQNVRYISITVNSVHGERFIGIAELQVGYGITARDTIAMDNTAIDYKGDWKALHYGPQMNGIAMETVSGKLKYVFHGDTLGVFAHMGRGYGKFRMRIDSGEWKEIDLNSDVIKYNQAVFLAEALELKEHTVEIEAIKGNKYNIAYMATNQLPPNPPKDGIGLWWILIGGLGGLLAVGVIIIIIYSIRNRDKIVMGKATVDTCNSTSADIVVKNDKAAKLNRSDNNYPKQTAKGGGADIALEDKLLLDTLSQLSDISLRSVRIGNKEQVNNQPKVTGDSVVLQPVIVEAVKPKQSKAKQTSVSSEPTTVAAMESIKANESKPKVTAEPKAKATLELKPKVAAETKPKVAAESKPKATTESKTKLVAESKPKVVAEVKPKVAAEPKAKATSERKAKVVVEPKAKVAAETKPKVVVEPKATAEPKAKVTVEPKVKATVPKTSVISRPKPPTRKATPLQENVDEEVYNIPSKKKKE